MLFNKQTLERIHDQLHRSICIAGDPLRCDRWVASSLVQKAIRRGDAELANRAASRLLELDKEAIWRRLVVIAFEDIGAADVDVLLEIVFLAKNREWRRASGEAAVLGAGVRRLAEATKDRSADYLACAARDHPDPRAPICSRTRPGACPVAPRQRGADGAR